MEPGARQKNKEIRTKNQDKKQKNKDMEESGENTKRQTEHNFCSWLIFRIFAQNRTPSGEQLELVKEERMREILYDI